MMSTMGLFMISAGDSGSISCKNLQLLPSSQRLYFANHVVCELDQQVFWSSNCVSAAVPESIGLCAGRLRVGSRHTACSGRAYLRGHRLLDQAGSQEGDRAAEA